MNDSTQGHEGILNQLQLSEMVGDDPKILDDGGEIPKSQGRGWRFYS